MPNIILPGDLCSAQPLHMVGIDQSAPISRGLIAAQSFNFNGYDAVDVANRNALIGAPPFASAPGGMGRALNGSNQAINVNKIFTPAAGAIMLLSYFPVAPNGSQCIAVQTSDAVGNGVGLGWQGSSFSIGAVGTAVNIQAGLRCLCGTWDSAGGTDAYTDGALDSSTSYSAPIGDVSYPFSVGSFFYSGGRIFYCAQTPLLLCVWNRRLTALEIKSLAANPWKMFRGQPTQVFFTSAGGTTLTVSDIMHGHTADNAALTQDHSLAVADALHAQTIDNAALTQTHSLVVADALHGHTVDNVVLTQDQVLTVSDILHGQTADNAALTQTHSLAVDDLLHGQTIDNATITQGLTLTVDDLLHGHTVDNAALSQTHSLVVADLLHSQTVDNAVLLQTEILNVQDSLLGLYSDNVTLSETTILNVSDIYHGVTSDNVDLAQAHMLTVNNILHAVLSSNANLQTDGFQTPEERRLVLPYENRKWVVPTNERS